LLTVLSTSGRACVYYSSYVTYYNNLHSGRDMNGGTRFMFARDSTTRKFRAVTIGCTVSVTAISGDNSIRVRSEQDKG